jgi:crotonobetainyl-CoA:carnitine CoA-transferase CaiB-like acyl-CoA transferase
MQPSALEGVRILDLSRLLPGPFATLILADLGADVIKIEQPGEGDYARSYRPRLGDAGAIFQLLNRNKRSLLLDLKTAEGKEIFIGLARRADVVIESFRPGVMSRLGLGYDQLTHENPRLIYVAITGFGQNGPYAGFAGHDLNYMAWSGALALSGKRGDEPLPLPVQVADLAGGALPATIGILAALLARANTGRGQMVDVSMTDGTTALLMGAIGDLAATGQVPVRGEGRLLGGRPCYRVYRTSDGKHVALAALEPKFWHAFCERVGRPDLKERAAPSDPGERTRVEHQLETLFATRTRAEWTELLAAADVCLAPVLDPEEALADAQLRARRLLTPLLLPGAQGETPQVRATPIFSETPATVRTPPPALGEHTDALLAELGYDAAARASLRAKKVV